MLFPRTRAMLDAIPASFTIQTPDRPTQDELLRIRAAAETHRTRVLAALLRDLASLPANLLRRGFSKTRQQVT